MNISLIGPSGCGKGTQMTLLRDRYDFLAIATGELFRENLQNKTALGVLAKRYMESGELVPDEIVDAMVEEKIRHASPEQGMVFDGFPRTVYQAQFLDQLFDELGQSLDAVIYLYVPDALIFERLPGRWICRQCHTPYHVRFNPPPDDRICPQCSGTIIHRIDDTKEIASARLRVFQREANPLFEYYQKTERLYIVPGEGDVADIHADIARLWPAIERREALAATIDDLMAIRKKPLLVEFIPREEFRESLELAIIGGPGSGKGTQAERLSKTLQLPHIASGDLFRENLKNQTDLGTLAKQYMDNGELVPDDITEAMIERRLSFPDTRQGFILDGFPRTLAQAKALKDMLRELGRQLKGVISIDVADDEIVNRLSGRLICRQCQSPYHAIHNPSRDPEFCDKCEGRLYRRDDDNPETIRNRLKTFHQQTEPAIAYYRDHGILTEIDGNGNVTNVSEQVTSAANRIKTRVEPSSSNQEISHYV
jgi:adenylate kinase